MGTVSEKVKCGFVYGTAVYKSTCIFSFTVPIKGLNRGNLDFSAERGTWPANDAFREKSQQSNWVEMRVRSDADAGLLMLQHRSSTSDDDFLALAIHHGRVEVALNLGKDRPRDPLVIRSSVIVADRRWHTITFNR